jgi:hypothetical protein
MLEDVLRDMQIDASIGEGQPFEVLIAHACHNGLISMIRKTLAGDVARAFAGEPCARAAIGRR